MITCIKFSSALRIESGNCEGMESSTVRVERFEKSILMVHSAVGRIHSWLFFLSRYTVGSISNLQIAVRGPLRAQVFRTEHAL